MKFSTNKEVVLDVLASIEITEKWISEFDAMVRYAREQNKFAEISSGNLREILYGIEIDQWRKLLMWGITLDDKDRDRIKGMVHNRFLSHNMGVIDWLNNGIQPSRWFSAEEDEFRSLVEKTFYPSSQKNTVDNN